MDGPQLPGDRAFRPDLERHQLQQLECVLRHAYDTMPFWHERLAAARFDPQAALSREWFATLPPLTRDEVQTHGESLLCRNVPPDHGPVLTGPGKLELGATEYEELAPLGPVTVGTGYTFSLAFSVLGGKVEPL